MTYDTPPGNFSPKFEIVSCFVEYDGKVVLLKRQDNKLMGGRWGLPAGKVENGEDKQHAIVREIKEETGIDIVEKHMRYFKETYHHHLDYDFIFHTFYAKMPFLPEIITNPREHSEFSWKTPQEILTMDKNHIVEDLDYICRLFYKI